MSPKTTTKHEWVDYDKLVHLNELQLCDQSERHLMDLLKVARPGRKHPVEYRQGPDSPRQSGSAGLQGLSGWIRRIVAHRFYHQIGLSNAGPTLLVHIGTTTGLAAPRLLQEYVDHRPDFLARLREEVRTAGSPSDTKQLKALCLLGLHNGSHLSPPALVKIGLPVDLGPIPLLVDWEKCLRKWAQQVMLHPDYESLAEPSSPGTFLSWSWQREENRVLLCLDEYFQTQTPYQPDVLAFDRLCVGRTVHGSVSPLPVVVLEAAAEHVFSTLGIRLVVREHTMLPTEADWARYWGPKVVDRIPIAGLKRHIYCLCREGQTQGFKRMGDHIMQQHATIPGVYVEGVSDSTFINTVLGPYNFSIGFSMTKLQTWFETQENPIFERLTLQPTVISFRNGFLELDSLRFQPWDTLRGRPPPLTNHFFDVAVALDDLPPTPLWDDLLHTQLGGLEQTPGELTDLLEVLIGRLFYPIGQWDQWQVTVLLKGVTNTGKSTVLGRIRNMFPPTAPGGGVAGLEVLQHTRVLLSPEMPRHLHSVVKQADFQNRTSGTPVALPRARQKKAKAGREWTVPWMMASSVLPKYDHDTLARYLVIFPWTTFVENMDTQLGSKIDREELTTIMLRCLRKYRDRVDQVGDRPFADIRPAVLRARPATRFTQNNRKRRE